MGDEGKGRLMYEVLEDLKKLTGEDDPVSMILKVNGGANSGHTAAGLKHNLRSFWHYRYFDCPHGRRYGCGSGSSQVSLGGLTMRTEALLFWTAYSLTRGQW